MATVLDLFQSPHFAARALTDAVNVVPNMYQRLGQLGVFPDRALATTYVEIEYRNGVLNLLPARERGGPATQGVRNRREKRLFLIPHIPHDDALTAADLQNRVRYGATDALAIMQDAMTEKLSDMANKHHITWENLRVGALKGIILDADGSVIYNLFNEFGITPKTVTFTLSDPAFDVGGASRSVRGYMEDNLKGDVMSGVRALCSPEFFQGFIAHPSVKEAYKFYQNGQEPLRNDVRKGFTFQDITWEEYRGSASYLAGDGSSTTTRFGSGTARAA